MATGQEQGPDSLVVRMLRDISQKQDLMVNDLRDVESRMTALEAFVTSSLTVLSGRLDRIETRLDRMERRLELSMHELSPVPREQLILAANRIGKTQSSGDIESRRRCRVGKIACGQEQAYAHQWRFCPRGRPNAWARRARFCVRGVFGSARLCPPYRSIRAERVVESLSLTCQDVS
jgi:hypothetical protein